MRPFWRPCHIEKRSILCCVSEELLSGQTPFYDEGIAEPMASWQYAGLTLPILVLWDMLLPDFQKCGSGRIVRWLPTLYLVGSVNSSQVLERYHVMCTVCFRMLYFGIAAHRLEVASKEFGS